MKNKTLVTILSLIFVSLFLCSSIYTVVARESEKENYVEVQSRDDRESTSIRTTKTIESKKIETQKIAEPVVKQESKVKEEIKQVDSVTVETSEVESGCNCPFFDSGNELTVVEASSIGSGPVAIQSSQDSTSTGSSTGSTGFLDNCFVQWLAAKRQCEYSNHPNLCRMNAFLNFMRCRQAMNVV